MPKLGNNLGELTSEIDSKKGIYIKKFVAGGPKNYVLEYDSGNTHAIVKGISLDHTTANFINFDSIKDIVTNDRTKVIYADQQKFFRNTSNWSMNTCIIKKMYRFVFDKRVITDNYFTQPYGF